MLSTASVLSIQYVDWIDKVVLISSKLNNIFSRRIFLIC